MIVDRMMHDKKIEGVGLTLVLTERIGYAVLRSGIDPGDAAEFLDTMRE